MSPPDPKLIESVTHVITRASQISAAYQAELDKLPLDQLLSVERLSSAAGIADSQAVLTHMTELTASYKQAYSQFMPQMVAELGSTIPGQPNAEAETAKMVESLNWHLAVQSATYQAREQWIDAMNKIFELFASCLDSATFGEQIIFAEAAELEIFEQQLARIEAAHQTETHLCNQRAARMAQSMAILGLTPTSPGAI